MAELSLIDGTIRAGVWHGIVQSPAPAAPAVEIRHTGGTLLPRLAQPVPAQKGRWRIEVPLPADVLDDGVKCLLVVDVPSGRTLQTLTVSAGAPLPGDLSAEVASLRAELEVLKTAFRRHARDSRES